MDVYFRQTTHRGNDNEDVDGCENTVYWRIRSQLVAIMCHRKMEEKMGKYFPPPLRDIMENMEWKFIDNAQ